MDTNTDWSFSQSFTPQFQAMRSELESRIEAVKEKGIPSQDNLQELSVSLAKASKALVDATGSIPGYDQKQYEIQLKTIETSIEALRASSVPKSKFAFKRKVQTTPLPPPAVAPSTTKELISADSGHPSSTTSSHLTLSSQCGKYLTRSSLLDHPQQTDLSIFDLDNCIVDLLPVSVNSDASPTSNLTISALHAKNLTNCILLLPAIDGSALLHDLTRCIVILGCHQFRMHSSRKIDIFLSISSNPIIEDCNEVRFTRYPARLLSAPEQDKDFPPFTVQDFSHIRPTLSPHYSMMPDGDKKSIEQKIMSERGEPGILRQLGELLPK